MEGIPDVDDSTRYLLGVRYEMDDVRKKAGPGVFPQFDWFCRRNGKEICEKTADPGKALLQVATDYKNWGVETAPPRKSHPVDATQIFDCRTWMRTCDVRYLVIYGLTK
jgi:hypothetical protein